VRLIRFIPLAACALAACDDSTTPLANLVADSTITADVATSAGDAIAASLETMAGHEISMALPGSNLSSGLAAVMNTNTLQVNRSRTCYDGTGAVVAGCSPLSSVRKIVTTVSVDGARTGSHTRDDGVTVNWAGAVHRAGSDTLFRNFTGATETSRTHIGVGMGHDTSTFSDGTVTRVFSEATRDSVKSLTWNLPRSANPFPVAGSIVRVDTVHVVATKGADTRERTVVWVISVDFPADAQGNVVLHVNEKTCNLNLVTRIVSNCQ
jgi:hypothetical protein